MKKWEYVCVYYGRAVDVSVLDELGKDGWELISVVLGQEGYKPRWIFKREKIESVKPVNDD